MHIYKLPRQKFAQDGKAILRSLQNDNLPLIDLVIRESFQNSLDATKPNQEATKIDVLTNDIDTNSVAKHFEGLEEKLSERFTSEQTVLVIQDRNTIGLQGITDERNASQDELDKSNFYKLVYGLSMNQEGEGKGGSWGLGKTSFFRIGIGIVAYYTRVKLDDGTYEERIAASLIEDPKNPDALIDSSLGLAWWGDKDNNNHFDTRPITNNDKISVFLSDFGIPRYTENETGTTIIIPFINRELFSPLKDEGEKKSMWWEHSIEDSIILAIQRWYGPRILNEIYSREHKQSFLLTSVNGKSLNPSNFEKTFQWFHKIYNAALNKVSPSNDSPIKVSKIVVPRDALAITNQAIGYVAYAKLSLSQLGMEQNYSPFSYVNHEDLEDKQGKGHALLAYSRKPGMVIEYETEDSPWFKNVNLTDNTFILAFFVPSGEALLRESYQNNYSKSYTTLESYLRDTENADHAKWIDKTEGQKRISLVTRIQKYTANAISNTFALEDPRDSNSLTSALQRKFGQILLPPENFGKSANYGRKSNGGNSSHKVSLNSKISDIKVVKSVLINESQVRVEFLAFLHKAGIYDIRFDVSSVEGLIDEKDWIRNMGKVRYPFIIRKMDFTQINGMPFSLTGGEISDLSVQLFPNNLKGAIRVNSQFTQGIKLYGFIHLEISDKTLQPELVVRQIKSEGRKGEE
ncbi:hypothetical protein [Enterococcus sp. N342-3-1-2]